MQAGGLTQPSGFRIDDSVVLSQDDRNEQQVEQEAERVNMGRGKRHAGCDLKFVVVEVVTDIAPGKGDVPHPQAHRKKGSEDRSHQKLEPGTEASQIPRHSSEDDGPGKRRISGEPSAHHGKRVLITERMNHASAGKKYSVVENSGEWDYCSNADGPPPHTTDLRRIAAHWRQGRPKNR